MGQPWGALWTLEEVDVRAMMLLLLVLLGLIWLAQDKVFSLQQCLKLLPVLIGSGVWQ